MAGGNATVLAMADDVAIVVNSSFLFWDVMQNYLKGMADGIPKMRQMEWSLWL